MLSNHNEASLVEQGEGYIIKYLEEQLGKKFYLYWASRSFEESFEQAYIYKTEAGAKRALKKISPDFKNLKICKVWFNMYHGWQQC